MDEIGLNHWAIYLLINGGMLFLHEFGHATACKKLGAEPGSIGFGFYLLSPVMFADVSDIWRLKRKERIYVNFSGIYIELLLASVLSMLFVFTAYLPLLVICSFVLLGALINLNPLLRYDGYWILSDATNTPNLRKVSIQKMDSFFRMIWRRTRLKLSKKDLFLVIYAIVSVSFIVVFLGAILIHDPYGVLSFPLNAFLYLKGLLIDHQSFVLSDLKPFILPFLFYFIVVKFLISKLGKSVTP